ncbi:MAG: 1-(5-phosphoribosyl)-5-[(5-phosphoribosylamino)methylideneamino]imidazole-4-carboxamide isomerase [Gammaproteobacteria bacterium]|nr:1-(5-phosphoribosyl)-5-[(5-phosphoribosylamino)methylideneamino]imidazole-4-carboxamide isomerase [Gammaproteobacteria bacterium]
MQLIPAIDLQDGRCVRLFQGDFARQTVYSDMPQQVAKQFERMGLKSLHVVDLDGAKLGIQHNQASVRKIADATGLAIQLGGGIRDADTFRQWLEFGVKRCVIGSLAVTAPDTVRSWFAEFGPARIVLALDVRVEADGMPMLATHGWTKTANTSLWECIESYLGVGLCHVLCTDISRDGALSGPNAQLYRDLMTRYPALQLQASGGVRHVADLQTLSDAGVHAAITGRALLDGRISSEEIRSFLPAA